MTMADGGFRPAYNVQFSSLPASSIILAVQTETVGADRGLAEPMAAQIEQRYGCRPGRSRADGGFQCAADIEAAFAAGTAFSCPPGRAKAGGEPYRVRQSDGPGLADWRTRMATPPAKDLSKRRSGCELIPARLRNRDLDRLRVRGLRKVQTWMTGFALAMNLLTERRLSARPAALPA